MEYQEKMRAPMVRSRVTPDKDNSDLRITEKDVESILKLSQHSHCSPAFSSTSSHFCQIPECPQIILSSSTGMCMSQYGVARAVIHSPVPRNTRRVVQVRTLLSNKICFGRKILGGKKSF